MWAQGDGTAWTNLAGLRTGDKIRIVELNSKKHSGTFVAFSDTAVSYQDHANEKSIPRLNVRSVKLRKNKHRLRNVLILGAVGAGVGAGIGAATYHSCSGRPFCFDVGGRGLPTGIGAALGLLGGSIGGALLPGHEMIYKAP
jgi:hypothetical protein